MSPHDARAFAPSLGAFRALGSLLWLDRLKPSSAFAAISAQHGFDPYCVSLYGAYSTKNFLFASNKINANRSAAFRANASFHKKNLALTPFAIYARLNVFVHAALQTVAFFPLFGCLIGDSPSLADIPRLIKNESQANPTVCIPPVFLLSLGCPARLAKIYSWPLRFIWF